jgi:signal transduction histidine kinase
VIELYNVAEEQPVGDEELRLLRAVADQAAIAIENARLYQAEALRAAELEALREVSLDITAELELDALLSSIVERAVKLLDAKAGEIYLHRPERDALVWTVGVGPAAVQSGTELRRGEGLSGRVWEGGQPLLVDYYHRWEGRTADDDQYDYTAVIGVPIAWGEEFLGVINVQTDAEVRTFTQDDAHLLSLFAAQAAVAIQNARLHQSTRRRAARLALINRVGQQTTAILDLDELLHQAVNLIGETFGYLNVVIMLAEDSEIVLKAATLPSLHALKDSLRFRIGSEGITGWVAGSGEPLLVPDVSKDARYYQTVMEEMETKSELAVPIKLKGAVIGVLDVQSAGLNAFSRADVFTLQTVADQLAVAIENAHLYAEAVARREQARELAVRLMDAQEEERRRIARELHDQVGQTLTAFKLGLEMGADQATDVLPALRDELLNAGRLVDELIDEVRTLSLELRPSTLDDMGLGMALVAYARDTRQRAGLDIDLELPDPPPALPPEVETAAYRIVQEALTNVVRHAQASHVSIRLSVADDKLSLDVSDDGVGFDVSQHWFDQKTGRGFGLLGIQERAERLGGRAYMDSQRGRGTRLRVEIPIAAPQPHPPNHTPERD